jgi:uncharacterized membrane protein
MIFGLALSIGALNLISANPLNGSNPTSSLLTGITLFGFSFVVLIGVWLRYTEVMTVLPVETRNSRDLNIALLFLVALEPYLFNQLFSVGFGTQTNTATVLSRGSFLDVSTTLWALDLGAIYAILALFTNLLAKEEKKLVAPELLSGYRREKNLELVAATAFFVSALPVFWTVAPLLGTARFYFWIATLVVRRGAWLFGRIRSRI